MDFTNVLEDDYDLFLKPLVMPKFSKYFSPSNLEIIKFSKCYQENHNLVGEIIDQCA